MAEAIRGCAAAVASSRILDARIAAAVFPGLAELQPASAGTWQGEDGLRVRALLYSSTRSAAATLVPSGYWIEDREDGVAVVGPAGEWTGVHESPAIALCLAALRARLSAADTAV